ncbi:nuclear transport factor 2 family protein [Pseudophaeobacter sp.]|uniref:nuclear transport factor 2 family protein n=1 Tax=Pseudophaeobacter sp. TaxID=1971739 RepID=UPI00261BB16F|nr:nuclear transport factor 2 family protein [Pseudophaeobacter sp.]
MTTCLHTLFLAWAAPSPEQRAALTDAAIGPNFYSSNPNAPDPIQGRDAYLDDLAQFSAMKPGATAKVVSVSEHYGQLRAIFAFVKAGQRMLRDQSFVELAQHRLLRVIGFSGMGEPD